MIAVLETSTEYSVLVKRVREVAASNSTRTAIAGPRTRLSYRELIDLVDTWAARLRTAAPGGVVALRVVDSTFLAPAFLAVRAAGLIPMLVDPHMPAVRRDAVLEAARPVWLMDVLEEPELVRSIAPARQLRPDAGYLGFTSGTQGPPKGIVAHERGVLAFVEWEIDTLGIGPADRIAMISPPTFEVVFRELFVALCSGAELVTADATVRADPRAVLGWLADQRISIAHAVPSLAMRWLAATPDVSLDRLRWTVFAGEPLHAVQVDGWRGVAPNSQIGNLYGPSETTLAKFWFPVPPDRQPGIQPVGRPLPGARLLPSDTIDGYFQVSIETPDGSFGYLDGTASAADQAALSRTGDVTIFHSQDLATLDAQGNLLIKGRKDSRVKRRGVFVDLGGVEEAASKLPGVILAGCVQRGPEAGGTIVLCVETSAGTSANQLRRELARTLGPESPDGIHTLPTLPLSANGKVDRRALLTLVEERAA
ncbi:hypothetical protein GCM10009745_71830 [Kribbella yunnanensis]|uniref:AMP-dependent synthetase/ligase domain-containing protein n=1 Tax=Kribbella yunnanensis TaxID=190194 RepID=A0ABN2IWG9_9ACTN